MRKIRTQRIKTKRLIDCNSKLYTQFRDLNHRQYGAMREVLSDFRQSNNERTHVNYILNRRNKVIAWSLIFQYNNNNVPMAYFYTRKKCRNMGFGSRLVKAAAKTCINKLDRKMDYWSYGSANGFFKKCSKKGIINKGNSVKRK